MPAHVAIEIVEPSRESVTPQELEAALVQACSVAVREGDCALDRDRPGAPRTATATVRWSADERSVRIELTTTSGIEPGRTSRSLGFSDTDERLERWRTAGLTIATLAGEAARAERDEQSRSGGEKKPAPPAQRTERTPGTEHTPQPKRAPVWVDLGGLVGTALDSDAPRIGVWTDVGARIGSSPFVGVVAADYATAEGPGSLSVQWMTLAVGAGVQAGAGERGLLFEGNAMFSLEREQASASDGTRADSVATWGYGGRTRAALVWQLGVFSPLIGAEGWLNAAPVRILVHDQYAGTVPRAGAMVLVGVRARFQ